MIITSRKTVVARAATSFRRDLVAIATAMLALCCLPVAAVAQDWPRRPVRIVSPFAAGGSSDTMGRIVAEFLGERLHQQFYIENRGGAGGLIGSALVANAPPDGYTFLISSIGTHVIAPATSASPGYDPIASFTHVAFVGGPPTVIAVHPALGVHSLTELIALLKGRSDALPYVSPGPGTIGNLIAEYWAEKESVKLAHVAYKGSGQAIVDLVAGLVQMGSRTWTAALGQMQAKTIIPLAGLDPANAGISRCSDPEGIGLSRARGHHMVWLCGAGRAAVRDHAAHEPGGRQRPRRSLGQGSPAGGGIRAREDVARGGYGLYPKRARQMGAAGEEVNVGRHRQVIGP